MKSPDLSPKLSVLMPVYNERATLSEILRRVQAVPLDKEIIIVDNCSTDGTRDDLQALLESGEAGEALSDARIRVVFQLENRGKGASVKRALALARGEWVIIQDADLEYDPHDFLALFRAAEGKKRPRDAVFGSRLTPGTDARKGQPKTAFYFGRVGLAMLFRLLYGTSLSDVAVCYKLMRRDFAEKLNLQSDGFDLDFELAAKVARAVHKGARVAEVPVSYRPRTELEGKKIRALQDGWGALKALVRFRFSR